MIIIPISMKSTKYTEVCCITKKKTNKQYSERKVFKILMKTFKVETSDLPLDEVIIYWKDKSSHREVH